MDYKELAVKTQAAIYASEYYVTLFNTCLTHKQMTSQGIDEHQYSDKQLINLFNDFWTMLPDSPSIRRHPFGLVCDIAEGIFDLDD